MNKELAKTLTIALVNYIDENRPEGSMCCSNVACTALEKAFVDNDFESVKDFIQYKLSGLTEFEQEVSDMVEYCKEHGEHVAFDYAKRHAKTLLAIAEKEIAKGHEHDVYIPEDTYYEQLKKQWEEGYDKGKVKALKDLPRWRVELGDMDYVAYGFIGGGIASEENPRVYLDGHSIDLYSLKKLPGFKEDKI